VFDSSYLPEGMDFVHNQKMWEEKVFVLQLKVQRKWCSVLWYGMVWRGLYSTSTQH